MTIIDKLLAAVIRNYWTYCRGCGATMLWEPGVTTCAKCRAKQLNPWHRPKP